MQIPWLCVDLVSMDLTLTALLYKIDAIALYGEPEMSHPHYLLGEHEATHMWTASDRYRYASEQTQVVVPPV